MILFVLSYNTLNRVYLYKKFILSDCKGTNKSPSVRNFLM